MLRYLANALKDLHMEVDLLLLLNICISCYHPFFENASYIMTLQHAWQIVKTWRGFWKGCSGNNQTESIGCV